jgi:hypothetical protein
MMELKTALDVLMQVIAQQNLNLSGKDIPTVATALQVVGEYLQTPSAESEVEDAA